MSIKVGDKFILEIAEKFRGVESGQWKYRIKGFDNLVFDEKGLKKLEKLKKVDCEIKEDEVNVGDEIIDELGFKNVVINIHNEISDECKNYWVTLDQGGYISMIYKNSQKYWRKTGKIYPIADMYAELIKSEDRGQQP